MTMRVTSADRAILETLSKYDDSVSPRMVASKHGIRTSSPVETASRHLIKLTKLGLAEKTGTRMYPNWRITEQGRNALAGWGRS